MNGVKYPPEPQFCAFCGNLLLLGKDGTHYAA
jgi:hypothetical protein